MRRTAMYRSEAGPSIAKGHPLDVWCPIYASTLIRHILSLTLISAKPLKLDSYKRAENELRIFRASALCTSRILRVRLLPIFWQQNTFSLQRPALCSYDGVAYDLPIAVRERISHLQLSHFHGAEACLNIAEGKAHRNTLREQAEMDDCCRNCRPTDFPRVKELFPNMRTITIDHLTNQRSRICFERLCRQVIVNSDPFCLRFTAVGQAQLMGFEEDAPEVLFVDLRLKKIWDVLRRIRPDVLCEGLDQHRRSAHKCPAVPEMKYLSVRTTERLIRLLYYYDYECNFLASVSPTTTSARYMPEDLRAEPWTMSTEFLTAFNVSVHDDFTGVWLTRGGLVDSAHVLEPDGYFVRASYGRRWFGGL